MFYRRNIRGHMDRYRLPLYQLSDGRAFRSNGAQEEHMLVDVETVEVAERTKPRRPRKLVLVSSPKGGAGKTHLTRNLAVAALMAGLDVGTVDLDPQQSLTRWYARRLELEDRVRQGGGVNGNFVVGITHYQTSLREAQSIVAELPDHELILVDTPTAVEEYPEELKLFILAADLVVIPCQPTIDDTDSAIPWADMIKRYGQPHTCVMNRTKAKTRSLREAKQRLLKSRSIICPMEVRELEDMHRVAAEGLGIMEIKAHPGGEDIVGVWEFVSNQLWR
jgi:chromosome partitioning protein